MTPIFDIAARVRAYDLRRAVPIRSTASLVPDPDPPFGISFIRMVSEQRLQAVAFGPLGCGITPAVVLEINPLGRTSTVLEPFASALDDYLTSTVAAGRLPRVWTTHPVAVELLELLGYRHRTDPLATPCLRRLGQLCAALAAEYAFPGQQVVAVAGELLRTHVVGGQSPGADGHPGALLAWVCPPSGIDPADEAARRLFTPMGTALLRRPDDDRVERLRKIARGTGPGTSAALAEVETLLTAGVLEEWALLEELRAAFWGLHLPAAPGMARLAARSRDRFSYALAQDPNAPTQPRSLARLLDEFEDDVELVEEAEAQGDARVREQMRRAGRVVRAELRSVDQPASRRRPCTLSLRTSQEVLRLRRGTTLQTLDSAAEGRVLSIHDDPTGSTMIELVLSKGFLLPWSSRIGMSQDWVDAVFLDARFRRDQMYRAMVAAASPLVYATVLPPASPRQLSPDDLLYIAKGLRTP